MELAQLDTRLEKASTLPAFPAIVAQALVLSNDPNIGLCHIERLLSKDPSIVTEILRTANSNYYGGNGRITTLQAALVRLGIKAIRSICITVAMQTAVNIKHIDCRFSAMRFSKHSMAVACGAKVLASRVHYPDPEEAFMAGLLHDVGKAAIALYLPEEVGRIYEKIPPGTFADARLEREICGFTHEEVGLLVAKRWGLPDTFLNPIAHHHTWAYTQTGSETLTALVHVANALAHSIRLGWSVPGETDPATPDTDMLAFLEISAPSWNDIRLAVSREVVQMSTLMTG